jgi:hypothetical protein
MSRKAIILPISSFSTVSLCLSTHELMKKALIRVQTHGLLKYSIKIRQFLPHLFSLSLIDLKIRFCSGPRIKITKMICQVGHWKPGAIRLSTLKEDRLHFIIML